MLAAISGVVANVTSLALRIFHRYIVSLIEVLEGAFLTKLPLTLEAIQFGRIK